ncbi:hypothetical protein RB195_011255 [Necator americanus]|uniref:Uncharacterized protein n=1 Tax=Necator americanus TaxID=51031 RepID=A0ABR1D3T4_NECAM
MSALIPQTLWLRSWNRVGTVANCSDGWCQQGCHHVPSRYAPPKPLERSGVRNCLRACSRFDPTVIENQYEMQGKCRAAAHSGTALRFHYNFTKIYVQTQTKKRKNGCIAGSKRCELWGNSVARDRFDPIGVFVQVGFEILPFALSNTWH